MGSHSQFLRLSYNMDPVYFKRDKDKDKKKEDPLTWSDLALAAGAATILVGGAYGVYKLGSEWFESESSTSSGRQEQPEARLRSSQTMPALTVTCQGVAQGK